MGVAVGGVATCLVLYLIVGWFGYFTFYSYLDGNLFNNFQVRQEGEVGLECGKIWSKGGCLVWVVSTAKLTVVALEEGGCHVTFYACECANDVK